MPKLPQVKGKRLIAALRKRGWYVDRTSGSHAIMRHEDRPGLKVVISVHTTVVKAGTLANILKTANLSVEELKQLL